MDNRFYDNEFEKYLKEEADSYRMYPSDRVWRNIHSEIHGYRRWPALTIIAVFIISALVVGTVLLKPHDEPSTVSQIAVSRNLNHSDKISADISNTTNQKHLYLTPDKIQQQAFEKVAQPNLTPEANYLLAETNSFPSKQEPVDEPKSLMVTSTNNIAQKDERVAEIVKENFIAVVEPSISGITKNLEKINYPDFISTGLAQINSHEKIDFSRTKFSYNNSFGLNDVVNRDANINKAISLILNQNKKDGTEVSSLARFKGKASKIDFQFYITPSVSYRRLVDNVNGELTKSYITALPFAANYVVDVNKVIQHTPATGYEVGFTLGYNINNKFAIRSGFQFNMRQYNINAYVHAFEPTTIALLTGNSSSIVNTISGFRNIQGSAPIILRNRYYEISMPVGIDWKAVNKKLSWGIAASVQPTYTFDKEPFIITSNYKNYADGSQLLRNWNINTNLETYIGYNTKNYRLQVGPQVRYQLMPTMSRAYPIREYLVDYGIKLSIIKPLR
ncbi:MAG TPA: outer membrane beta-barrel protein [Panacibacter sp.]|nr:outer membrane beta-barrel protein [Panacibacter sp.]